MKNAEDDSVVCSVEVPFTVNEPKAAELTTNIGEQTFIAGGDWVEFTFSTIANDFAGLIVYGGSDFGVLYEDKIAALEYKAGDSWIDMKGQNFGGSGFPLADATSTFRVKFTDDAAGDYTFMASMKNAEDDSVVCSVEVPFTVKAVYTVTFTDGVEDEEIFANQTYTVTQDDTTPVFNGTPTRDGYVFIGWTPEISDTASNTVTYTAIWEKIPVTGEYTFIYISMMIASVCTAALVLGKKRFSVR